MEGAESDISTAIQRIQNYPVDFRPNSVLNPFLTLNVETETKKYVVSGIFLKFLLANKIELKETNTLEKISGTGNILKSRTADFKRVIEYINSSSTAESEKKKTSNDLHKTVSDSYSSDITVEQLQKGTIPLLTFREHKSFQVRFILIRTIVDLFNHEMAYVLSRPVGCVGRISPGDSTGPFLFDKFRHLKYFFYLTPPKLPEPGKLEPVLHNGANAFEDLAYSKDFMVESESIVFKLNDLFCSIFNGEDYHEELEEDSPMSNSGTESGISTLKYSIAHPNAILYQLYEITYHTIEVLKQYRNRENKNPGEKWYFSDEAIRMQFGDSDNKDELLKIAKTQLQFLCGSLCMVNWMMLDYCLRQIYLFVDTKDIFSLPYFLLQDFLSLNTNYIYPKESTISRNIEDYFQERQYYAVSQIEDKKSSIRMKIAEQTNHKPEEVNDISINQELYSDEAFSDAILGATGVLHRPEGYVNLETEQWLVDLMRSVRNFNKEQKEGLLELSNIEKKNIYRLHLDETTDLKV